MSYALVGIKFKDLTGIEFGRLTVVSYVRRTPDKRNRIWLCKCNCGAIVEKRASHLTDGSSKSCGCIRREASLSRKVKSDKKRRLYSGINYKRATYSSWSCALRRCNNVKCKDYPNYGGRGIRVCERWLDFRNFLEDMGDVPHKLTLDRIEVNGNYEPGNCRWATQKEQQNNRTNNRIFEYAGESLNVSQWAERYSIKSSLLNNRIYSLGWTIEKALSTPVSIKSKINK